jgi:hypothetical protein
MNAEDKVAGRTWGSFRPHLDLGQAFANVRDAAWYWIRWFPDARATTTWLAIITATHLVLKGGSARLDNALLLSVSTNLHNLGSRPISVLITSACFITSTPSYYWFIVVCVFVLAPLEHWIGTGRFLLGLVIGHVASTLAVAIGLAIFEGGEGQVVDVGVSYGVRLLAALYVYRWTGWVRWAYAAALVGFAASQVVLSATFTDWGHLFSVLLGLAIGSFLVKGRQQPKMPVVVAILAEL